MSRERDGPAYPDGFAQACLSLTDPSWPGDGLTRCYLLSHPAAFTRRGVDRRPAARGVVAVCRRAREAEHPLVVLRAGRADVIPSLLAGVLAPGERHYFIVPPAYRPAIEACLDDIGDRMETVVLVPRKSPGDQPERAWEKPRRTEAHRGSDSRGWGPGPEYFVDGSGRPGYRVRVGETVSSATTLWRFGRFAEIGVSTAPAYRRLGYAAAVAEALTLDLEKRGLVPLYVADRLNTPSLNLAAKLGFVPSGAEEYACSGVLRRAL